MTHQCDQSHLAEQSRFTAHIRSGKNNDLLIGRIQYHIVGNIGLRRAAGFFQLPGVGFLLIPVWILRG